METTLRFYWVVPQRLAAGPYPEAPDPVGCKRKLPGLLAHGVRAWQAEV